VRVSADSETPLPIIMNRGRSVVSQRQDLDNNNSNFIQMKKF